MKQKQKSVSVFCGIILGGHHQTSSFSRSSINRLNNVYHLLLVLDDPVDLVVVTGAQIDHDVFVSGREKTITKLSQTGVRLILLQRLHRAPPEKEHDGAGVVQLVHLVEIRHFCDVHQINDSKILYLGKFIKQLCKGNWHFITNTELQKKQTKVFENACKNKIHNRKALAAAALRRSGPFGTLRCQFLKPTSFLGLILTGSKGLFYFLKI